MGGCGCVCFVCVCFFSHKMADKSSINGEASYQRVSSEQRIYVESFLERFSGRGPVGVFGNYSCKS